MADSWRIFVLLMYKNLIVRKRHWKMTIFLEALVPVALFVLIQAVRDFSVQPPKRINESIPIKKDLLLGVNRVDLYFVPNNEHTTKIMELTRTCLGFPFEHMTGFPSEDLMLDTYTLKQAQDPSHVALAVVFERYDINQTKNFRYKIRHSFRIPSGLYDDTLMGTFSVSMLYHEIAPFVQLQMCVDKAYMKQLPLAHLMPEIMVSIQQMPYPSYIKIDEADALLRQVICMFAVVAFLIPLCIEASFASKEKFIGVNVLMAMNGVKLYQNLLSWLVNGLIFSLLYVIPIIVLFKNTFSTNVVPYVYYGNAFIFWLFLTAHVAHLISFGMHVAAYFSKPRFVIITLTIIYTAALSIHENMLKEESFSSIPYLGIIFPNMLLYKLLEESNVYESQLTGIQWKNIFIVGNPEYDFTGSSGMIFLFSLLGTTLHFNLAVYVNEMLPGKYGVRKDPLYIFKYFKRNKVATDEEAGDFDYDKVNSEDFEAVPKGVLTPGIQIRNVKKTYNNILRRTKVQALRGISVDFYKGQITALLGHNGAGKTTLMSILTGLTSQTEGKVFVNGKNVKTDLDSIRKDLGLCPQENMVFPDLNVFEQIEFFGLLKGRNRTRKQIQREVRILLGKLKLSEKRNFLPDKLSGGQKRRLCLGMALIGNASTVILDEPTSGMDPETRRDTWDIVLKMRGEKTILISTHNMEEADILGDRIAIVHAGRLRCYGTPMFLKKQYGHGHVEVTLSTKSWCSSEKVLSKFDSKTQPVHIDSEKIVLSVPYSDSLPLALDKVNGQKKKLGVTGISVSLITLEQVFLKVVQNDDNSKHLTDLSSTIPYKAKGWELTMQTAAALFHKKLIYTKKNISNLLMIIVLPLLSVLLLALSYNVPTESTDVVPLRLDMYRSPQAFYTADNDTIGEVYKNVVRVFNGRARQILSDTNITQALLNVSMDNLAEYRNHYIVSAEFNNDDNALYANALYSGTASHSLPLTMNILSNTLVKTFGDDQYLIEIFSQKLPSTLGSTGSAELLQQESLSRVLIFCSFYFATVALFVVHPLQEMSTKVKQLQRMTGVSSVMYWGTMVLSDLVIFSLSMVIIILGFYVMDVVLDIRLYHTKEIFVLMLLMLLFGINTLAVVYIFSFIDKSRNTLITILSVSPLGLVFLQYLLHMVISSFEKLRILHIIQKSLFRLIPYVSFFHAQLAFYNTTLQNARCRRVQDRVYDMICAHKDNVKLDIVACCDLNCSNGTCKNPLPYFKHFEDDISLETNVVYLCLTPLIYFTILMLLEEKVFSKLIMKMLGTKLRNGCDAMDEQVKKEKHAVALEISKLSSQNNSAGKETKATSANNLLHGTEDENSNLFLVYELSKYYGKLMAVKEVNFRVKQRECFGLLGVNGAGKSTTFRMLTGEEIPNSGNMYLAHADINSNRRQYLSEMGYCPQTDALITSLNAFDHLRLFASLRGIPKSKVDLEVNKWINRLNLTACMKQPSGTYSGGNKRRLNIAMALIGNPTLVLLDEPTTGVDPAARRSLWNVLQSCQAGGQAIILTSHSMEECEALCNRLVIMVRGQLVCIGASQELKQRFGAGYDIHIKLNPGRSDNDVSGIKATIEAALTCEIRDENLGFIAYHVTDSETTWEKMYSTMNELKRRYSCIEDFSVLSATLEQLFIQFARGVEMSKQEETPEHHPPSQAVVV